MLFMQHLHLRRVAKPSVLVGLYCKVSWRRAGRWNLVITWSLFFWSIISAYTIHVSSQYNSSRIADRKRRRSMAAVMHTLGSLNSSNQASSPQSSATRRTPQSLLHCACSAQSAQEQKSLNPLEHPTIGLWSHHRQKHSNSQRVRATNVIVWKESWSLWKQDLCQGVRIESVHFLACVVKRETMVARLG